MKQILLAYDGGSPPSARSSRPSSWRRRSGRRWASSASCRRGRAHAPVDPWDDRTVHAEELLEARRTLREAGIEAEMLEPGGDVARTIERVADERGYDTIVVGTRGLGSLAKTLQGSVSEHVAAHAHTTVIVAR